MAGSGSPIRLDRRACCWKPGANPRAGQSRPHIGVMQPDLSDEDIADLAKLIKRAIDDSRYPFSPEVRRWKELLAKLQPEPIREPRRRGRWRRRAGR